jgi:hypothetical protein
MKLGGIAVLVCDGMEVCVSVEGAHATTISEADQSPSARSGMRARKFLFIPTLTISSVFRNIFDRQKARHAGIERPFCAAIPDLRAMAKMRQLQTLASVLVVPWSAPMRFLQCGRQTGLHQRARR